MTEPIDQATKGIIREEARKFASFLTAPNELEKFHHIHTGYVKGASVWAERLKQQENEVSLRESQQDVMAADMVKLMDQIEYQKKAEKKDYDRIKKLEFRLKQERNKVIDECIYILETETGETNAVPLLESLKDKSHE